MSVRSFIRVFDMFNIGDIIKVNPVNKNVYTFIKDEEQFEVINTYYNSNINVLQVNSVYCDYTKEIPFREDFYIYSEYFILAKEQKQIKEIDLKDFEGNVFFMKWCFIYSYYC